MPIFHYAPLLVPGGCITGGKIDFCLARCQGDLEPSLQERIQALIDTVTALPASAFRNKLQKLTLLIERGVVKAHIVAGTRGHLWIRLHLWAAQWNLENDILPKTDGESPPPDWVIDPGAQMELEAQILVLIGQLERALNA